MSEPFLGEIRAVGFNFAPRGWLPCQGQLLSIPQNSALFSLLGTTFGGDGIQTFALPDYRGRGPVGIGNGPGLTPIVQGEVAGNENVSIGVSQMPAHIHTATATVAVTVHGNSGAANATSCAGAYPATVEDENRTSLNTYNSEKGTPATWASDAVTGTSNVTVGSTGGSLPVPIRNPYLGTNYIIATEGIFPSRP